MSVSLRKTARRRRMLSPDVARLAMKLSAAYSARYDEYLADCESDRANGYRAHYCEHGTDQWTDYDNICGGCEEGYSFSDGVYRRTVALTEAKKRMRSLAAMQETMRSMRQWSVEFDHARFTEMMIDLINV
jgi:hypothetical protein